MKSYCVKEKKQTECVQGSEQYVRSKNGRTMLKCKCQSCGITKTKLVKSQNGGATSLFDLGAEMLGKTAYKVGKAGLKKGIKSNFAKRGVKNIVNKYSSKIIDNMLDDASSRI